MSKFSICMIARNEEKNLLSFFEAVKKYFPANSVEIILVDTGSSDSTKEIARSNGSNVYDFTWINDFSAARNFAISKATNDWILALDCDEYLNEFDFSIISEFMQTYPNGLGDIILLNQYTRNGETVYDEEHIPRFFSRKYYHFEYPIHEQIMPLSSFDEKRFILPIKVTHVGYNLSEQEKREKCIRNSVLLLEQVKKEPDNPYWYFQLGQSAFSIQDYEKAYVYFEKGFALDVNPADDFVRTAINSYGHTLINLNHKQEALQFENIYEEFKDCAEFVCMMGEIYFHNEMYLKAMKEFLLATTFTSSSIDGANTFIPYYNMGIINEMHGNKDTAIAYYKKCGDFCMAKERLQLLES